MSKLIVPRDGKVDSTQKGEKAMKQAANFIAKVPDELIFGDIANLKTGYMAQAFIVTTMPHSKPEGTQFIRRNGNITLVIQADDRVGLPYGSIARLLLAWVTSEAVRTQSATLTLGRSLADFMRTLGLDERNTRERNMLAAQMDRLFKASISLEYEDKEHSAGVNMRVVKKYDLWWKLKNKDPELPGLTESTLTLDEDFFKAIIKNPVIFYMAALKALKKSPMAIDIYLWLTHRNSYAKGTTVIPWEYLQAQLGADYAQNRQGKFSFKEHFIDALKKVAVIYPEAKKLQVLDEGLLYIRGKTHVPQTKALPTKQ